MAAAAPPITAIAAVTFPPLPLQAPSAPPQPSHTTPSARITSFAAATNAATVLPGPSLLPAHPGRLAACGFSDRDPPCARPAAPSAFTSVPRRRMSTHRPAPNLAAAPHQQWRRFPAKPATRMFQICAKPTRPSHPIRHRHVLSYGAVHRRHHAVVTPHLPLRDSQDVGHHGSGYYPSAAAASADTAAAWRRRPAST